MIRLQPKFGQTGRKMLGGVALLGLFLWTPSAQAAPDYDDGAGNGCVSCHPGFQGGNGALHNQHRIAFGATTCNLCHPSGGGTTPVKTYTSGAGGGFGCAGCHGQDYGETSPNSGQPKSTAYGLRQLHVAQGVTSCGNTGCHQPGALGHTNPFPPIFGEEVVPRYYAPAFSNLTNPCVSAQEDLVVDVDTIGLDNDGDGVADSSDPDCAGVTTTTTTTTSTTTTTTIPLLCGVAPAPGCIPAIKGSLLVSEKSVGKEKVKVALKNLQPLVTPSQFGDPVMGNTQYRVCIYDSANQLRGSYRVARAGETCGTKPCWSVVSGKGFKFGDKSGIADGITKIGLAGGDPGKGKVKFGGKNVDGNMPAGVAAALASQTSATAQVLTSDAACFTVPLTRVKKADGLSFSAVYP
jgi:hypothetical protein